MRLSALRLLAVASSLFMSAGLFADSTDDVWRYVPLTKLADNPVYENLMQKAGCTAAKRPTGVITNGDWQLFVIQQTTPDALELNILPGGWANNEMCAWISGKGVLDLSKPILSEDGQAQYAIAKMSANALRYGCVVTHFTAPTELKILGDYVFYRNSTNIISATFRCPYVTTVSRAIFYNHERLSNLKSLILDFPNATSVLDSAFCYHASMTTFEVNFPKVTQYGPQALLDANFSLVKPEDFNLQHVRTVGTNAFYVYSASAAAGQAFRTDTLYLDDLEWLDYGALCYTEANTVILGRENLRWTGARALSGRSIPQIVFGSSPEGTELEGGVSPADFGVFYRYWFQGTRPKLRKAPVGDEPLFVMREDCQGMIFIRQGDESWAPLIAAAREPTAEERTKLEAGYADVVGNRILGVIEPTVLDGALTSRRMFLAYGDYRAKEHLLYVKGEPMELGSVMPAYGMSYEYAPGSVVNLTAPSEPVAFAGGNAKATKYVVEELDAVGRWTKVVTNEYTGANAQITMPESGTSMRVTWIFDVVNELEVSHDSGYDNENVTVSAALDEQGKASLAYGSTVTLTAEEESDGPAPKARFAYWIGDIGDADPSNRVLNLVMDRPRHVTAVFDHDWYIDNVPSTSTYGTMTDGKWTLNFYRKEDVDGNRVMKLGNRAWGQGVVISGSGRINLDTDITDVDGLHWVVDEMADNTFRFMADGTAQSAVTECIFPKTVTTVGKYTFYACTSVTNVVMDCPVLTKVYYGCFYGCMNLSRFKMKCDILEDFDLLDDDREKQYGFFGTGAANNTSACLEEMELILPKLKRIPPMFCRARPLTRTDATNWRFDSVTNVMDYAFCAEVYTPGPYGMLSLPSLETISGKMIAFQRGFDAIRLGSGKLRDLGSSGVSSYGGAVVNVGSEFGYCQRLGMIELGLAPNANIEEGVFSGAGLTSITNVTFTGAAPSSPALFEGLAVRAKAGRKMMLYASSLQPGWTDGEIAATRAATGIVPFEEMSAEDQAAVKALPREDRFRFMGQVYSGKPFGLLFDTNPWVAGFTVILR